MQLLINTIQELQLRKYQIDKKVYDGKLTLDEFQIYSKYDQYLYDMVDYDLRVENLIHEVLLHSGVSADAKITADVYKITKYWVEYYIELNLETDSDLIINVSEHVDNVLFYEGLI